MKTKLFTTAVLSLLMLTAKSQNVFPKSGSTGIGTTIPKASAILDVDTIGKGVLIPRMTKAQRDAIVSPAASLLLYQTDNTPGFYYFDGAWKPVTPANEVQLQNNNLFVVGNYQIPITTGDSNTVVGSAAFNLNSTGRSNAVFGNYSMGLNSTGWGNTAMGYRTLTGNTGGYENVAIGYGALMNSTFGIFNTVVGAEALMNKTTTGWGNAVFGQRTLINNSGDNNAAFGSYSMMSNTSGAFNVSVGVTTMNANTTGKHNTAIGNRAMLTNTIGSFNTVLGDSADVSSGALTNATAIGYKAKATASNMVQLGNNAVTSVKAGNNIVIVSDGRFKKNIKENVPGLDFIKMLKPVTYNYDVHSLDAFTSPKYTGTSAEETAAKTVADNEYEKAVQQKEKKIYTGFIAQDVDKAAGALSYDFSGVYKPQNDKDAYGLSYADFVVPLVKAVQELSAQNEKLVADMQQMKDEMAILKANKTVTSSNTDAAIINDKAVLGQNQPNPFGSQTLIPVKLPQHFSNASVVITETATGRILKTIAVTANTTQLTLDASSFAAGTLTYTLYVDGRKTDSKQMVHISTK